MAIKGRQSLVNERELGETHFQGNYETLPESVFIRVHLWLTPVFFPEDFCPFFQRKDLYS
jgi:hypothetical protein